MNDGKTWILSQWYREEINEDDKWFYAKWRAALHKYCPGVPVLIMHNGGPTDPPYTDVEIVHADNMHPHGRGEWGHWINSWRSPCQGMKILKERGAECVVFIGQNLIVGTEFIDECRERLRDVELLFNYGCMGPYNAFVEYYAANPQTGIRFFEHEYQQHESLIEVAWPLWVQGMAMKHARFPGLHKMRDWPMQPGDTFTYHVPIDQVRQFCEERGI